MDGSAVAAVEFTCARVMRACGRDVAAGTAALVRDEKFVNGTGVELFVQLERARHQCRCERQLSDEFGVVLRGADGACQRNSGPIQERHVGLVQTAECTRRIRSDLHFEVAMVERKPAQRVCARPEKKFAGPRIETMPVGIVQVGIELRLLLKQKRISGKAARGRQQQTPMARGYRKQAFVSL